MASSSSSDAVNCADCALNAESLHFLKPVLWCLFGGFSRDTDIYLKRIRTGWMMTLALQHRRASLAPPTRSGRTRKRVRVQFTASSSSMAWSPKAAKWVDSWGPSAAGWHAQAPPVEPLKAAEAGLGVCFWQRSAFWALSHYVFFLKKKKKRKKEES